MPDDVSVGETYRRLQDHERRTQREHEALDTRITNLARDTVPLQLYQQGERDRDDDMKAVTDRLGKVEDRPAMSLARWLGIVTVVVAFLALAVQAWGTLKGAQ
ncbi:hypothetical protein [Actinacidiphila reveromycinica]|uniref:hypothetical protein n=1 Tax=Actinacidiphila reveromycinica TaxID=659352 RepID=UPI001924D785|nr:hypothetical protein [Streptomyces sp. SN-593]